MTDQFVFMVSVNLSLFYNLQTPLEKQEAKYVIAVMLATLKFVNILEELHVEPPNPDPDLFFKYEQTLQTLIALHKFHDYKEMDEKVFSYGRNQRLGMCI